MSTPPDYGEPWELTTEFAFDISIKGELAASFESLDPAIRALNCANACQGMTDPAAEIQAMRDAIKEGHDSLKQFIKAFEDLGFHLRGNYTEAKKFTNFPKARNALAKLQPFIKP